MEESVDNRKIRTVIHVFLKATNQHLYFGSVANIYEHLTHDDVGITYASLRNYGLSASNPYENSKCIIRKGKLLAKKTNRGMRGHAQ